MTMTSKMMFVAVFLCVTSAWGANYTCTSSTTGDLSNPSIWSGCNSTYPHNNGGDKYVVVANHAIRQDVSSLSLGFDDGPFYGYVEISKVTAGSGYVACSGGSITGGTSFPSPTTVTKVVNGGCELFLTNRGVFSAGTPTLGSISATNASVTAASTVRGNPTTLSLSVAQGIWNIGSTQSITIAGATGTGWTSMNATWTATVVSAGSGSNGPLVVTIPFDSSALSGTPGGTITAAPGVAASYSLSYIASGGTAAIKMGNTGSFTLGTSTTTTISGDVVCSGTFNSGTDCFVWDGTGATTASPTVLATSGSYIYTLGHAVSFGDKRFYRTSNCAQNASDPTLPGNCKFLGNSSHIVRGNQVNYYIDGLYFKWVGDETNPAIDHAGNDVELVFTVKNSLIDTSGRIKHTQRKSDSAVIDHNQWINTAKSIGGPPMTVNLEILTAVTPDPGVTFYLRRNSFDGQVGSPANVANSGSVLSYWTVQDNFFGGGVISVADNTATWDRNFLRRPIWSLGANARLNESEWSSVAATVSGTYYWIDADSFVNPHSINVPGSVDVTVSGLIFGYSGTNPGDSGEIVITGSGTSGKSMTIQNSVALCSADGTGSSEFTTVFGSTTSVGYRYNLFHNTACQGFPAGGPYYGMVRLNETGNTATGSLTMKSNLVWSNTANSALKANSIDSTSTNDACSPLTDCDYNGSFHRVDPLPSCSGCTNMQKGYQGRWSSTGYATNDVDDVDPLFVDKTRKIENFDHLYLALHGCSGCGLASTWSSGGTYAYGDIVSNSDPAIYGGETFNYRCTNTAGCTGLGGPGINGTAWRANWEFASAYWLRTLNYLGTQYNDSTIGCAGGCYVVQALNQWVTAGFAPQASQFKGTAHDGGDIGAVLTQVINNAYLPLRGVRIW